MWKDSDHKLEGTSNKKRKEIEIEEHIKLFEERRGAREEDEGAKTRRRRKRETGCSGSQFRVFNII